jgi:hypothetical protein
MSDFFKQNILVIVGIAVGALTGYLYWKYIGCYSGTCAITSRPLNSTVYGTVLGGLLFSLFKSNKKT